MVVDHIMHICLLAHMSTGMHQSTAGCAAHLLLGLRQSLQTILFGHRQCEIVQTRDAIQQ